MSDPTAFEKAYKEWAEAQNFVIEPFEPKAFASGWRAACEEIERRAEHITTGRGWVLAVELDSIAKVKGQASK